MRIGDDARLAGARAREDEQRPFAMQHGFALFGVELFEEVHGGDLSITPRFAVRGSRFGLEPRRRWRSHADTTVV